MLNDGFKKLRIFVISHDSSLTGAPILLLNLLSLFQKQFDFKIRILLSRGGFLEDEFKKYGAVTILKSRNYSKQTFFLLRGFNFIWYNAKLFFFRISSRKADLILNNTVANGRILKSLSGSGAKVITYVHELESVIQVFAEECKLTFKYSDVYMSPSMAITNNLIERYSIPIDKIFPVNYYFPIPKSSENNISKTYARDNFHKTFKFLDSKFYVVGMGSGTYRKGIDIFVDAAIITSKISLNIHFVWIGEFGDNQIKAEILREISLNKLEETLTILDPMPHSLENLLPFDVFILSSREDPYPLVVLEAALMKVPTLCFANTGGAQEFVGTDCGWIINEVSPQKLSEKIVEIENNKREIKTKGENAFKKCVNLHTNENLIGDQLKKILKKI